MFDVLTLLPSKWIATIYEKTLHIHEHSSAYLNPGVANEIFNRTHAHTTLLAKVCLYWQQSACAVLSGMRVRIVCAPQAGKNQIDRDSRHRQTPNIMSGIKTNENQLWHTDEKRRKSRGLKGRIRRGMIIYTHPTTKARSIKMSTSVAEWRHNKNKSERRPIIIIIDLPTTRFQFSTQV